MKATFLMPLLAMCSAMASDIMMSFCGVLKTQRRLASCGSITRDEAASEMVGVCPSLTTSSMARALGVVLLPRIRSTLCSVIRRRALAVALVVSLASSSTM